MSATNQTEEMCTDRSVYLITYIQSSIYIYIYERFAGANRLILKRIFLNISFSLNGLRAQTV